MKLNETLTPYIENFSVGQQILKASNRWRHITHKLHGTALPSPLDFIVPAAGRQPSARRGMN